MGSKKLWPLLNMNMYVYTVHSMAHRAARLIVRPSLSHLLERHMNLLNRLISSHQPQLTSQKAEICHGNVLG